MRMPNPDIPNIPNTPELGMPLSFGPVRPVVLFPVRMETRFFLQTDGSYELRVRVYPDKIHIDSHEPELTSDELIWGQHFWKQTWLAGNDEERGKTAWRQLADRFDPPRAAWIARALKPLNPEDRPANPEQPSFPSITTKDEAWTRAPETRVLPNFWIVLGYKNGRLVVNVKGGLIKDKLAAGPNPKVTVPDNPEQPALDAGMKWMVDFDAAEEAGMGIRAKLTGEDAAAGLDYLLVMGIRDTQDGATDWTPLLAELLDAHHYTDGLSFVLQGTPSNNTADAPSGFSSKDPGHEASYLAERTAPAFKPGDGSNADVLTTAFGLGNAGAVFSGLPNATAKEQLDARKMNTALWPATWGYFLAQMMSAMTPAETTLTADDSGWGRQHFIDYVRAAGPLPALRIGKQPYGILPVTSLNYWKPKTGQEQQYARDAVLKDFLMKLRELWRRNLLQVPYVGRSDDPDQDFADIFSMDGISSSYAIRHLLGETYLRNLWSSLVPGDQKYWWNKQQELTKASLNAAGLNWNPRLSYATYSGWHTALKGPVTQAELFSEDAPLEPDYIGLLLNEPDFEKIRKESFVEFQPKSLLYSVLRHAMLLEYWTAALNLLYPEKPHRETLAYWLEIREKELIGTPGVGAIGIFPPLWELLDRPVPGVTDRVGNYLHALRSAPDPNIAPHVATLLGFRESLAHLNTLSAAKLQRHFAGTLDLCSHRLDAWITSFATKRLAEMRQANPTGILFGGYGWVMNLKPADAQTQVAAPPGEQAPIFESASNPGFVHTPSLTQAATAAVLRSGHLSHSGNQMPDDLLAIDLSSERVRLATWLLDGVRQGQPLGALLGYRFERRLQEAGKPQFISYFRELAPLVARKLEQTDQPVEAIAANNVVDGLELHRRWLAALDLFRRSFPVPGSVGALSFLFSSLPDKPESNDLLNAKSVLEAELNLLADAIDAVSDALTAENVYQVVRGNPLRAAGTVESIAGGETPPPELEVVRTPRTGIALTHRLLTLFSGEPVFPPEWAAPANPFRANAEPHLNAWAAKLLGNPVNVRCLVERLEAGTGKVLESKELRLSQLRLAPLDFIYAVEGGQDGQQAEIEQRILYTIMRKPDGFAPGSLLRVSPGRKPKWKSSDLGYGEFNELLRTARRLITGARAIDADDLNLPERSTNFSVDVVELEQRATAAEQSLRKIPNAFKAQLATPDAANPDLLRELIIRSAGFGVAGAVPLSAVGDSLSNRRLLLAQADSILKELAQRVAQLTVLAKDFKAAGPATQESKRDYALARLRVVFGKAFVVLPRFTAANAAELEQALAGSTKVQGGDPFAATTWFQRMARVRDGVARINATFNYCEALNTGEKLKLTIAQLPYDAKDRWVGLPFKAGKSHLRGGKLSLVVQSIVPVDVRKPLAGLLIDEWVEVVPSSTETTGLALQYDQPNAAPPQTILLAVPPELESPWTIWSLQQVLLETLDLARIRAIDPDALDEVGHYLPALYFACNTAGDTVATDFTKIK
ncbi:MAG: hypothetical protein ACXWTY_00915 [Methylobacter sp.]